MTFEIFFVISKHFVKVFKVNGAKIFGIQFDSMFVRVFSESACNRTIIIRGGGPF